MIPVSLSCSFLSLFFFPVPTSSPHTHTRHTYIKKQTQQPHTCLCIYVTVFPASHRSLVGAVPTSSVSSLEGFKAYPVFQEINRKLQEVKQHPTWLLSFLPAPTNFVFVLWESKCLLQSECIWSPFICSHLFSCFIDRFILIKFNCRLMKEVVLSVYVYTLHLGACQDGYR